MSRIVVTGANGFVGRAVCQALLADGHEVTGLVRRAGGCVKGLSEWLHEDSDFAGLDQARWPGGDCVIHLAARVHVMEIPPRIPTRHSGQPMSMDPCGWPKRLDGMALVASCS